MTLDREIFEKLLASLDPDRDQAGEIYEGLHERLVSFFQWRESDSAEDLADRTLDRVARKVMEGKELTPGDPLAYFHAVARHILNEHRSERGRKLAVFQRFSSEARSAEDPWDVLAGSSEDPAWERQLRCLDRCLERLSADRRSLIIRYYEGGAEARIENRKALARGLGMPVNALRIRSHRLRLELESCVEECLKAARSREMDFNPQPRKREGGPI